MPVTETIRVDRERFMFLVAALATASCSVPRGATQPEVDSSVAGEQSPALRPTAASPAVPESRPSEAPSVFIGAPTLPRPEPAEAPAGPRVTYTVDECVQVLSSLSDAGERGWASGAMGPTREGCKLMFPVY